MDGPLVNLAGMLSLRPLQDAILVR